MLGSGTSHGVPAIGCACRVCTSADPRDRRRRCAIAIHAGNRTLLVDTPPDLRAQAIGAHIQRLDALLYTHAHADHLFGLDDIRRFNEIQERALPVFAGSDTLDQIRKSYDYIFTPTQAGGGKPRIELTAVRGGRFEAAGVRVEAIPVLHGQMEVLGFRIGGFAYVTDASEIPSGSRERLRGLHTLILGALRWEPHPTHMSIDEAIRTVEDLRPGRTFFTHMAHTVAHRETDRDLPAGVRLAYDGLVLEVPEPDQHTPAVPHQ